MISMTYTHGTLLCFSINSDGTAVPVPSDTDQAAEEGCGTAADGPSWPATFNSSTTDSEDSAIPKEVRAAFPLRLMTCVISVFEAESSCPLVSFRSRWIHIL